MGGYRLFHISNHTGHIERCDVIEAEDDDGAIRSAATQAGPNAMELWQQARRIKRFERTPPDDRTTGEG